MMRRIVMVILLLLLLVNIFTVLPMTTVAGRMAIFPSRLYIDIKSYTNQEVKYNISVYNEYSHPINVSIKIGHPTNETAMLDGYSFIPDLSWIEFAPQVLYISAGSSGKFSIHVNIPDSEKPLHYNESWEVWSTTSAPTDQKGGTQFVTALTTRLLITTPPGEAGLQVPSLTFILLTGVIGLIATSIAFFYLKTKKRSVYKNKSAMFYIKRKERNDNDKRR